MPDSLHVGITGTRRLDWATPQARALGRVLADLSATTDGLLVLHHGCCVGADWRAHEFARKIGGWRIEGHPGHDANGNAPWRMSERAMRDCDVLHPALPYGTRNEDMDIVCPLLVAAPLWPEGYKQSGRSGTWQRVRMARSREHPITFVWPDGTVTEEKPGA